MTVFIDGDFKSGVGNCKHHCSPSCHPLQTGPDWVYGCTHIAWPANKYGDFVPIVSCQGNTAICQIPKRLLSNYKRGLSLRVNNNKRKQLALQKEIDELNQLTA